MRFRTGKWPKTRTVIMNYYSHKTEEMVVKPLWLRTVLKYEDEVVANIIDDIESGKVPCTSKGTLVIITLYIM